MTEPSPRWWGEFRLRPGEAGSWLIGPLALRVQHQEGEWVIGTARSSELDDAVEVRVPHAAGPWSPGFEVTSFAVSRLTERLVLLPILPPRSLVVRPEARLSVPQEEEVTLRVRAPLWVKVGIGEGAKTLVEVPSVNLPSTWFGPSPTEGELCYALRASGRLRAKDLVAAGHEALVTVRIRNRADTPLLVERINLPVESLRLYEQEGVGLLTNAVNLDRVAEAEVNVRVDPGPPVGIAARLVTDGRVGEGALRRAFGSLFR